MGNRNGKGMKHLDEKKLVRGLGWFSLGLGLAGILAPRRLGKAIGVGDRSLLLQLVGLRELVSGIGILTRDDPAPWIKGRVAGDMLDLALLGAALFSETSDAGKITMATAAVAGVTALDVRCSRALQERPGMRLHAIRVRKTVTINRSPEELYRFWRQFDNLPQFMAHLESVQSLEGNRSHWVAKGPAGTSVEWDAELINDKPGELIAWRSLENSQVDHAGSVRFERATGNRGTVVKVDLQYAPPAGVIGASIAKLFGESPDKQIEVDLLRFKQLIETGEIARTEGQPAGRSRSTSRKFDDFIRA